MSHTYPLSMLQEPFSEPMSGPIDAVLRSALLFFADCLRTPHTRTATVENNGESLSVLSAPFPDAPCTGCIPDGTSLTVQGRCGSWYAVCCNEARGFVSGDGIVLHY